MQSTDVEAALPESDRLFKAQLNIADRTQTNERVLRNRRRVLICILFFGIFGLLSGVFSEVSNIGKIETVLRVVQGVSDFLAIEQVPVNSWNETSSQAALNATS